MRPRLVCRDRAVTPALELSFPPRTVEAVDVQDFAAPPPPPRSKFRGLQASNHSIEPAALESFVAPPMLPRSRSQGLRASGLATSGS
jgi:hypothetical protein